VVDLSFGGRDEEALAERGPAELRRLLLAQTTE